MERNYLNNISQLSEQLRYFEYLDEKAKELNNEYEEHKNEILKNNKESE